MPVRPYFPLALQTSAAARARLNLTPAIVAPPPGREAFARRQVAAALQAHVPAARISGAQVNLLAQLTRIFRFVAKAYLTAPGVSLVVPEFPAAAEAFIALYPPGRPAAEGKVQPVEVAAELFVLAVQSRNPAAGAMATLYAPDALDARVAWRQAVQALDNRLVAAGAGLPGRESLLAFLLAPLHAAPHSLAGQLGYIGERWGGLLPPELLDEIRIAFALVSEEEAQRGGGPGPTPTPDYRALRGTEEFERFSPDRDWMPNVVLIAKTVYVWLDQLSRLYGRPIERLDEIPDAELDRLNAWGFTSLWLIGIWERSKASETIKRMMGNHDAVASAYSLYDYVVSADLGGEAALERLGQRCRERGIRLACDVVPNHTGIDSRWSREHPDWFIQVEHPPYPAYAFSGANLSTEPGLELRIEDGYWTHRDAAVVFQHVQHGRVRYIYHGNDGTHLPWNDTAQLNFLREDVREAMIQTILAVARRFRIIRFDAAMTLAKKHFERLWYPQPGASGVPSRAEHALMRDEFDRLFPEEFWRQVVDRVASEVPDTLLLAEAFWLMEGYFVRTLGMHRVYNSAFMNMLKREENAKFRGVIRQILEFDSGILQRFVNFMNNPDEETAVAQFGKGDKYFAVATLLATMPGLPMFGHGQIEGFEEKYGMEYRRPRWQEVPDEGFIAHHHARIFPLLRRRPLFSGADAFFFYDFLGQDGVNDNVFVFSNRFGEERALVVVHNAAGEAYGRIGAATPKRLKGTDALLTPSLADGLGLGDAPFWRFRDAAAGRDYLRRREELLGADFSASLGSYGVQVLLDWQALPEDAALDLLCTRLGGRPVVDLDRELVDLRFAAEQAAARRLFAPAELRALCGLGEPGEAAAVAQLSADFALLCGVAPRPLAPALRKALAASDAAHFPFLAVWLLLRQAPDGAHLADALVRQGIDRVLGEGLGEDALSPLLLTLLREQAHLATARLADLLPLLLADPGVRAGLGWHAWEGAHYVGEEAFLTLLDRLTALLGIELVARGKGRSTKPHKALHAEGATLAEQARLAAYQVEKFCDIR